MYMPVKSTQYLDKFTSFVYNDSHVYLNPHYIILYYTHKTYDNGDIAISTIGMYNNEFYK